MKIIYSDHARKRMKERGVEDWEVEQVLNSPEFTKKGFGGKREAVGYSRSRKIKAVFVREENYIKVVTVI